MELVSVPAGHAYVQHLLPPDGPTRVRLRPDPDPGDPSRVAQGRWWPPVALRPEWLAQQDFDVLHVHFGFDAAPPERLERVVQGLRAQGRPLVLTVHDLRSPHQPDPGVLAAQLDVLVPAADAVVTLTGAAAAEIRRRWHREATVIPHPHVVPLDTMRQIRSRRRPRGDGPVVVGLSCKDLRPNTDPLRLLPTLERVCSEPGLQLRVDVHRAVMESPAGDDQRRLTEHLAAVTGVEVVVHDRFDDAQLFDHLSRIDVAVLPYRFGTHSGWLETCHDVGTLVLAPSLGCYADQGADGVYQADETALDEASLADGVRRLAEQARRGGLAGADADERLQQRRRVSAAHERLYAGLLSPGLLSPQPVPA